MPPPAPSAQRKPSTSPVRRPAVPSIPRRAQTHAELMSALFGSEGESETDSEPALPPLQARRRSPPAARSRPGEHPTSSTPPRALALGSSLPRRSRAYPQIADSDEDEPVNPAEPADPPPPIPSPPPPSATRINRTAHNARRPQPIINSNPSPSGSASSALSSPGETPPSSGGNRPRVAPQSSDSSIRALDDDEVAALGGRRFTAAEKGKGRAVVPEVVVFGNEKDKGKKRKSDGVDERSGKRMTGSGVTIKIEGVGRGFESEVDEVDELDDAMDGKQVESEDEEGEFLDEFSCPVCFCSLTKPVATICGHILCSECLHSSLLSAVGRNPNPLPAHLHALHHAGPAPRAPARAPRANHTKTKAKSNPALYPSPDSTDAQPVEWTQATLQAKVVLERKKEKEELERAAEAQFEAAELPRESWQAAKIGLGLIDEGEGDGDGKGLVVEVLKGLWRVPEGVVIEGECPVCRNAIPGGMGPFNSGIGSITPLFSVVKM